MNGIIQNQLNGFSHKSKHTHTHTIILNEFHEYKDVNKKLVKLEN